MHICHFSMYRKLVCDIIVHLNHQAAMCTHAHCNLVKPVLVTGNAPKCASLTNQLSNTRQFSLSVVEIGQ
jgi:hypothetical protein